MEKNLNKIIGIVIIPEVLLILVGCYLYLGKDFTAISMSYLIAPFLFLKGYAFLRANALNNKKFIIFDYIVPYGILNILYGLLIILNIFTLEIDLHITISAYIIATSLIYIIPIIKLKKISKQTKILFGIVSALIVTFGIILASNVLSDLLFFNSALGVVIIFYGILNIMALMIIKKNNKKIR